jgi:hypothetical protein
VVERLPTAKLAQHGIVHQRQVLGDLGGRPLGRRVRLLPVRGGNAPGGVDEGGERNAVLVHRGLPPRIAAAGGLRDCSLRLGIFCGDESAGPIEPAGESGGKTYVSERRDGPGASR